MKFSGKVGNGPGKNRLNFGDDRPTGRDVAMATKSSNRHNSGSVTDRTALFVSIWGFSGSRISDTLSNFLRDVAMATKLAIVCRL